MLDEEAPNIRCLLGHRVRELRKLRGLSQESFADICGLDRTYIGGVERGERNIGVENVYKIATSLRVTLSYLFENLENE